MTQTINRNTNISYNVIEEIQGTASETCSDAILAVFEELKSQKIPNLGKFPECAVCMTNVVLDQNSFKCQSTPAHILHEKCATLFSTLANGKYLEAAEDPTKFKVKCPTCQSHFKKDLFQERRPVNALDQVQNNNEEYARAMTFLSSVFNYISVNALFGALAYELVANPFYTTSDTLQGAATTASSHSITTCLLIGFQLAGFSACLDAFDIVFEGSILYNVLNPYVPHNSSLVPLLIFGGRAVQLGTTLAIEHGIPKLCGLDIPFYRTILFHIFTAQGVLFCGFIFGINSLYMTKTKSLGLIDALVTFKLINPLRN